MNKLVQLEPNLRKLLHMTVSMLASRLGVDKFSKLSLNKLIFILVRPTFLLSGRKTMMITISNIATLFFYCLSMQYYHTTYVVFQLLQYTTIQLLPYLCSG